jgi:hypothetical protein
MKSLQRRDSAHRGKARDEHIKKEELPSSRNSRFPFCQARAERGDRAAIRHGLADADFG